MRTYAKVVAGVLVALAVAGATILHWGPAANLYHLGLALLFAYVGFLASDHGDLRRMVGAWGYWCWS